MILLPVLIVIGCVIFWFCASGLFNPIGKFINRILSDVNESINENNNEERKEKKQHGQD